MFPLYVFWLQAPQEGAGTKPGHELHVIRSGDQDTARDKHIRSVRMESVARYIASRVWDTDQEMAVRLIEFPWSLVDRITFDAPNERKDLYPAVSRPTEQEQKRFITLVGEFLKLGQRLHVE